MKVFSTEACLRGALLHPEVWHDNIKMLIKFMEMTIENTTNEGNNWWLKIQGMTKFETELVGFGGYDFWYVDPKDYVKVTFDEGLAIAKEVLAEAKATGFKLA